jgi:hypothetical protein
MWDCVDTVGIELIPHTLALPLAALSAEEGQTKVFCFKGDHRALLKIERVAGFGLTPVPALVGNDEGPADDDFHLVVGVGVDKRDALL